MSKPQTTKLKKSTTKKSARKSGPVASVGVAFEREGRALETWLSTEIVPSIGHVYTLIPAANRNYKQGNTRVGEYNRAEITHTMMAIYQKLQSWVDAESAEDLLAA